MSEMDRTSAARRQRLADLVAQIAETEEQIAETEERVAAAEEQLLGPGASGDEHRERAERARHIAERERREQQRWGHGRSDP